MSASKREKPKKVSMKQNSAGTGSSDSSVIQSIPFLDPSKKIVPTTSTTTTSTELEAKPSLAAQPTVVKPIFDDIQRAKFGIPLDSNKCHCFACYDDFCEWPECAGTKGITICCCCHYESVMCKSVQDPTMWRVLRLDSCNIVVPRILFHRYCQCLCYQCFIILPDLDLGFTDTDVTIVDTSSVRDTQPLSGDPIVCLGGVCCILSLRGPGPAACCTHKNFVRQGVLCCQQEAHLCQPVWHRSSENPDLLCLFGKCSLYCADPVNLVKSVMLLDCVDLRMAVPCDDDAPCVYTPLPFCACGNGNCEPHCFPPIRTFQAMKDNSSPPPVVVPQGMQITRSFA